MKNLLNQKFFPAVIKPGRYAGGELGQIVKSPENRVSYLHAHPDKYELGMSHVGMQSLYHIVNKDDRFLCERVFAIDSDAEEVLRRETIPLFSLESRRPARDFDCMGFTLVDETVYTSVLTMLDLANIPLRSTNRTDNDPLIIAGGPATFNPEPMAPFVDLFFIGDAEEGLPEILTVIHENRGKSRRELLEIMCRTIDSVYIPAFYDDSRTPTVDFAPEKITARIIPELKAEYYPDQPLVPLIEITHEHLGVEIMRGCPQGCRFCMAGPTYKPVRPRPKADILNQVKNQLDASGYGEVTLLSLSSSDYPNIDQLASSLARTLEPDRVSLSLPSLRPGSISPSLLSSLNKIKVHSLTIAPEAGTERLRLFIRKDFPDAAIFDTVRMAFARGCSSIKLYFMVGLPSETEEDLLGIVELCRKIHAISREFTGKHNINVTLSPFVPKPHTPFQWDESLGDAAVFERIQFVRRKIRTSHTGVKHNSTQLAQLSAVLGRGGRETAEALEAAFRKGCRFDGWSEHFSWDTWQEVFAECKIDQEARLRALPFEADLPWSHIRKGPSVDHLKQERQRTSLKLKDYTPFPEEAETASNEPAMGFGRSKKKAPSKNTVAPTKSKVRLRWGRAERFRYMSHLDNARFLERLLRRARWPVAYSQGFRPSMKVSFGPPLSVGFTSEAELMEITLDTPFTPSMLEDLTRVLPRGFSVYETRGILTKTPSLSATLNRALYAVPLTYWTDLTALQEQTDTLLARDEIIVERARKDAIKTIDIRPSIYDIRITDTDLELLLGIGEGGYARPHEVMHSLTNGMTSPPDTLLMHRKSFFRAEEDGALTPAMQV